MTTKNMSIAALIGGILGIVGPFIPIVKYFSFLCGIAGIVFGVLALKKIKNGDDLDPNAKGLALGGLITGIVGTVISVIGLVCVICAACIGVAALGAMGGMDMIYTYGMFSALISNVLSVIV